MSDSPQPSRKLPPADRDFEIYEAVHVQNQSTWLLADRHHISQTRVRQIIRRVVEWLGEVIPPQTKVAKEQEVRLAREIAADRFQHQLEEVTNLWNDTRESKYAGIRIRLTTAQARLGAVGGVAAGLAADAIEGLPVPAYEPPPEPNPKSKIENPKSLEVDESGEPDPTSKPEPRELSKSQIRAIQRKYPWLFQVLGFSEITPEIIAAREAVGVPYPPSMLDKLYDWGYLPRPDSADRSRDTAVADLLNAAYRSLTADPEPTPDSQPATPSSTPQSEICNPQSSPPPPGDCSTSNDQSTDDAAAVVREPSENSASVATCEREHRATNHENAPVVASARPLLTAADPMPITELRLSPDQPGPSANDPFAIKSGLRDI